VDKRDNPPQHRGSRFGFGPTLRVSISTIKFVYSEPRGTYRCPSCALSRLLCDVLPSWSACDNDVISSRRCQLQG